MGKLRQQWEYMEEDQKTEIVKLAQAKNKANKIYSVSESQITCLLAFSFLNLLPHHNMNYSIPCFQTPIPASVFLLFHIPYWVRSLAEAASSCLTERQADQHRLVDGEAAAFFFSWVQRPFCCCCFVVVYSHYLCLYLKICIFWGKKECMQSRRHRKGVVIDNSCECWTVKYVYHYVLITFKTY